MADKTFPTYTNPVYHDSFPDPFVLKSVNEYFAFCTGHAKDGRVFGMLNSVDLVNWRELPGAMEPLPAGIAAGDLYWAPEVTAYKSNFYLYYSVGNETFMEIRVAASPDPAGPYADTGRRLTFQDFAIDPHVFIDDDGSWYMFYATDFLEHSHIGTGTVVDRMIDPFTLSGHPIPVTRAQYDWQVYDPARQEKGGVRWHTVEGPFVLKRKGRYFEMFSGGNWQNITYGVGYAVTDSLDRDDEWPQMVDGLETLPLLHTIPGKVVGPGHNSVVRGPNGRELYCVYHRWENDKRVLCLDRMDFAGGDRLFVAGPSFEPQPMPFAPTDDWFEETFLDKDIAARGWRATGDSTELANGRLLVLSGGAPVTVGREVEPGDFEMAVNLRITDPGGGDPSMKFGCGDLAELGREVDGWYLSFDGLDHPLPDSFSTSVFHQFRMLSIGGTRILYVDGLEVGRATVTGGGHRVEIIVRHATAEVDMIRYTNLRGNLRPA